MVRKLWMTGESIVTTLELWACLFCEVKVCMRGLFIQEHVAAAPNLFLDGLLGDERRKGTKSARFMIGRIANSLILTSTNMMQPN